MRRADLGRAGGGDAGDSNVPRVGGRIVVNTRIAVVLPAPFGAEHAEDLTRLHRRR